MQNIKTELSIWKQKKKKPLWKCAFQIKLSKMTRKCITRLHKDCLHRFIGMLSSCRRGRTPTFKVILFMYITGRLILNII